MEISTRNRKRWIVGGAVLAAIYFAPTLIRSARQVAMGMPFIAHAFAPKPVATPPPPPPPSTTVPNPAIAIAPTRISGLWKGSAMVANRGRCQANLEITPDPLTPDRYTGALITTCIPAVLPFWGKTGQQAMNNGANALTPANAIVSGTFKDKSMTFNIDKSIAGTCPITGATVTPFGTQLLALQWKDGCGVGDLLLAR